MDLEDVGQLLSVLGKRKRGAESSYAPPPRPKRKRRYTSNLEKKFLDTAIADATIASTMTFYNLGVIPQGTTESQRVGRKVTVKSIHIDGLVSLLAATDATNTSCAVRMRLVEDTQTNGAQFAATDMLETDSIFSFHNLAETGRFRTLAVRDFVLKSPGAAASGAAYVFGEDARWIKINKTCNIPLEFDNSVTTGAIGSAKKNTIWLVFQTSTGEITVSNMNARIRYVDA